MFDHSVFNGAALPSNDADLRSRSFHLAEVAERRLAYQRVDQLTFEHLAGVRDA